MIYWDNLKPVLRIAKVDRILWKVKSECAFADAPLLFWKLRLVFEKTIDTKIKSYIGFLALFSCGYYLEAQHQG